MFSIYDNITTPEDLVSEVMARGFRTETEDICRAQDIFGNAPIEDLVFLANDIGRNDENGNPDPKGTRSSGRRGTRDTFYNILFKIWNYEDAVRFWNEHTNPEHEEKMRLYTELADCKENCQYWMDLEKQEHSLRLEETAEKIKYKQEVDRLESEVHDQELKIMELKAKLYDLMVGEKE